MTIVVWIRQSFMLEEVYVGGGEEKFEKNRREMKRRRERDGRDGNIIGVLELIKSFHTEV